MVESISQAQNWNAPYHPNQRYRLTDLGKDPATVSKRCTNASQPSVTIDSLREQLGINKSAVQHLLSSLKEKGYIAARDYEGGWRVLITPSI